jgi:hypothetical protein
MSLIEKLNQRQLVSPSSYPCSIRGEVVAQLVASPGNPQGTYAMLSSPDEAVVDMNIRGK